MQKLTLTLLVYLLNLTIYAQNGAEKIWGKWANEDKSRVIEFVQNGDKYDAIICGASDKSIIGKKRITGLKPFSDETYSDGTQSIL